MRKARRKRKKLEYSVCGDGLLLRCDGEMYTQVTAVMPEWLMVSIGDVVVEWEGGRVVIRDAARNTVLHEGDAQWR
jgi:hypothetical protein